MIRYREIRPSARLRLFIDKFWVLEHEDEDAAPQRVVPDGHAELILNWSQPYESFQAGQWQGQPHCFLAGQLSGPLLLRPKGPARMLGIRFRPHGVATVLARPIDELSGRFTPVDELSPALSRNLDRAMESSGPIVAVQAALLSSESTSRGGDLLVAEAVRRITFARGALDLSLLARDLGLSIRQLERRFLAAVGLQPKLFSRIQRFNHVFRVLGQPTCNWVETALDCGYHDQAHLIRDCKDLSGSTPAILFAEGADLARHFYMRFGASHSYNTARRSSR